MTHTTEPTIDELYSNPCIKCYACDFSKDSKCYKGSYKQCSVCAVIQNTIDKCQALISDQVAKARIEELLEQQKLLSDINKGYTRNPTNQSNYIRKAIAVDEKLATINGVKNK